MPSLVFFIFIKNLYYNVVRIVYIPFVFYVLSDFLICLADFSLESNVYSEVSYQLQL